MNLKNTSVLHKWNQNGISLKLKIITISLLFTALSFSTFGATFRVIINPGGNEMECTFTLDPGDRQGYTTLISGTNGTLWRANYSTSGRFGVDCSYVAFGTFTITRNGTYNGTISWLSTYPVKIIVSGLPGPPTIASNTIVVTDTGSVGYTITATSELDFTYDAPTDLPSGLSYNSTYHRVTGSLSNGIYYFTASATNAAGQGTKRIEIRVLAPPRVTSSSYITVNQGAKLAYTITATNSPSSYSVAAISPSGTQLEIYNTNKVRIVNEADYTAANDKSITFSVSAANAAGTGNARIIYAKYQGRVEVALYNDADANDIDADGINPQGFSLVTGTLGTSTFSLTNSEYLKVYTNIERTTEFTTPGEDPPALLYLKALAPVSNATASISRNDLFPLSDSSNFSVTMAGPDIDGRLVGGNFGADASEETPANLESTGGAVIELKMAKGAAELGDLKLEFSSGIYDTFYKVYYDSACMQPVGNPPYYGTIVASPTGITARLCNGSLYIKPLAPVADGVAKFTYTNSAVSPISDEVHFKITMTSVGITGYKDLAGNDLVADADEENTSIYEVDGPFKINISRGDLLAGTVSLKVSADGSGTTSAAKFYTDSGLTTELTSMSVDLSSPTGALAPLAANGTMNLYVMPLIPTDSLNIDLEYANGGTDVDSLKIKVGMIGVNITGYVGNQAIPEKPMPDPDPSKPYQLGEDNPLCLTVPVYDAASVAAGTTPGYVKIKLERGSLVSGKIKFKVEPKNAVHVYLDANLTNCVPNSSVVEIDATTPTGYLKPLSNGEDGDMYLYLKPVKEGKITATIAYQDSSISSDKFCFTICNECPCTGCPPGKDGDDSIRDNNINSKFTLGSNSFGKPAGSIYLTSADLSMGMAGPGALQIVPFQGTTIAYTYDPNDATIVTDIDIDTGVTEINISFTTASHGSTKYYTSNTMSYRKAGEGTAFRTVTITNDYTPTDQGGGNYTFAVNFLNISNALTLSGGTVTKTAKYEKPDANTWKLTRNGTIIEYLNTIIDSSTGIKTETFYIGSMETPVYKDTNVYNIYPWGDSLIQNIGAETTTYEYYDNNSSDGMKIGNLKKITYPKGDTVEYTYGANGNLLETLTTKGGHVYKATREVFSIAKINDGAATTYAIDATTGTFDYGTLAPADTLTLLGTKEINKQYCDNTLTSHSESINYYDYSAGVDQHTAYDDTTPYTTTSEYYSDTQDTIRYGRVKKVINSDDTIALYNYTRNGGQETVSSSSGEPNGAGTAVINGSKSVSVYGENGVIVSSVSYAIVAGTETQIASATTTTTDSFGRITKTTYMDSTTTERSYGCCGVDWEIDRNGVRTDYLYDETSKLMTSSERNGIITLYSYDQAGNTLSTTLKGRNDTELETTNVYNQYGVMTSSTDPMDNSTTYTNNGDTVTYPNSTTSITNYTNGVVSGTSGTAVHAVTYSSGIDWQKVMPADITSYTDMLGRQYKTVFADSSYSETFYNSKGQAVKTVSPAGKITLSEYDAFGRVYKSAIDMNLNSTIDGDDEVTQYTYAYGTHSSKTVAVTTVTRIVNTNSKVLSVSESTLDGMESWTTVNGLVTHSLTERLTAGQLKTTVEYPDGSKTITTSDYGLTSKVESFKLDGTTAGNVVEYTYDEFDRIDTVTEKYGETIINEIVNSNYNDNGQPLTVTTNGRATTYIYNNMGQRTSVTLPGSRTVNYTYKATGELDTVDGAETYKQSYAYDSQGRMSTLSTFKSGATAQNTTWGYNNRGFMTSKTYADSNGTTYTYNDDGQLATRVWDRGITTSYSYDNAGRQLGVDYSDSTPDITYTYDWMGNPATVGDAEGTRTFAYNYTTTGHPGLVSVTTPGIVNHSLNYTYDGYGRRTVMSLQDNSSPVFTNNYGYDATSGRLATIGDGTYSAHYTYQDGTGLLTQNQIKLDSTSAVVTTHNRTYDARTNNYHLLTTANTTGETTRTYTYVYNTKDQRTKLTLADGTYWEYTYDDKGQVTNGTKKDSAGNLIAGQYFGYSYDGIGNRVYAETKLAALKLEYTTNNVNQYTQIDIPGVVPVLGEADADTTVKAVRTDINNLTGGKQKTIPTRSGKYFSGAFTGIDNSSAAQTITYDVYAIKDETTTQQVHKESSTYTVPKKAQTLSYDTDGNCTGIPDLGITLIWNGENRMIEGQTSTGKVEYAYDYMGRRISKKGYAGSTGNWTLVAHQKFVYNGFKQIAEYNAITASDVLQKTYTWQPVSLDVPLWVKDGANYYYYIVDGNKNVRAMVDTSGTEVAQYDYNPFGKVVTSGGAYKSTNPFRFSSEYHDDESGLIYYNYRYYSADLGRWINRDPVEEFGGVNLYAMVNNDSINFVDYLGNAPANKKRLARLVNIAIARRKKLIKTLTSGGKYSYKSSCYKKPRSNCKALVILIELPDPAVLGEDALIGHTGVGIRGIHQSDFWDYGPENGNNSSGRPWWDWRDKNGDDIPDSARNTKGNRSLTDILKNINNFSEKGEDVFKISICICSSEAKKVKKWWNNKYKNLGIFNFMTNQCTTNVRDSLNVSLKKKTNHKGIFMISPEGYLRTLKVMHIKHSCGTQKGKDVKFTHFKKGIYSNPY